MDYHLYPLGDQGVLIELGEDINLKVHERVKSVSAHLEKMNWDWVIEYVPAFASVAIHYDPMKVMEKEGDSSLYAYEIVCAYVEKELEKITPSHSEAPRTVEIPVCYGGEFGPDLAYVAESNDISEEKVIDLHVGGDYLVYMIGFAPGFPYIGGMPEEIATPRRKEPRLQISAGSVGIAGKQTGVYPIETPGGWQLIGQTPKALFRPENEIPSLLQAGDKINFKPITREEFDAYKEEEK
ncbi:5-oxoprolinase subunit PxpB [Thalassobacillus pellis]|uniref:5-oxoprolinase subunit PxpB n=1 Tax=Thalassobacillus pellis TaxID=748008 RepID=UPI00196049C4|nr:5-oxoprolinase subunit PxpB [Thalassobacillus pellis]MBM7551953.1 inhibitor of KinA [Thalassobacillus pellis]